MRARLKTQFIHLLLSCWDYKETLPYQLTFFVLAPNHCKTGQGNHKNTGDGAADRKHMPKSWSVHRHLS